MKTEYQPASVIPRDLTFTLLENITNNFSEDHKIGTGGYGEVYKGVLDSGEEIAVKKLYQMQGLDDNEFEKEFNNLMRVQHQNIVRLVGYCYETRKKHFEIEGQYVFAQIIERALCFEYLAGGSLDKHISDESCGLDWHARFKIIKGICEGLNYLHNGSQNHIYHLDMKPANILLDENMMPKIADFGLSILFSTTKTFTAKNFIGTRGYMPPEYIEKCHISKKYDVFSLGVIIIQIMFGLSGLSKSAEMSPQKFADLVHENWMKRFDAISMHTSHKACSLEVKMCIQMALRCVDPDREKRPTVAEVINKLNEIETLKRSLGQISESKDRRVEVDPTELRFPFELNKQISSVLQLTNKSDGFVAFRVKANQSKYSTQPDKGVMSPWSKCYVIATMQPQEHAPLNMQCSDMFVVQSTTSATSDCLTASDSTEDSSFEMEGEVKVPVVYAELLPDQPSRPSH